MTEQFVGNPPHLFTPPEVAKMIDGLDYRTLHNWIARGLVVPTHPSRGPGTSAAFDAPAIEDLCVLADLRTRGIGLDLLAKVAHLQRDGSSSYGVMLLSCCETITTGEAVNDRAGYEVHDRVTGSRYAPTGEYRVPRAGEEYLDPESTHVYTATGAPSFKYRRAIILRRLPPA